MMLSKANFFHFFTDNSLRSYQKGDNDNMVEILVSPSNKLFLDGENTVDSNAQGK